MAVVGQVGCGKSSLMSAFLGEMHKNRGVVRVSVSLNQIRHSCFNLSINVNIKLYLYEVTVVSGSYRLCAPTGLVSL